MCTELLPPGGNPTAVNEYISYHIIKQTIKKRREFNLETHMAFLDLEKAFDRVRRKQMWQILNRRGMPYHLIEVIKSLYKNTAVQIDTGRKILDKVCINQRIRQGCNLSPALFNIYIDDLLGNWKHKADAGIMLKRNLSTSTHYSSQTTNKLYKTLKTNSRNLPIHETK
jgi:hypothetical protein